MFASGCLEARLARNFSSFNFRRSQSHTASKSTNLIRFFSSTQRKFSLMLEHCIEKAVDFLTALKIWFFQFAKRTALNSDHFSVFPLIVHDHHWYYSLFEGLDRKHAVFDRFFDRFFDHKMIHLVLWVGKLLIRDCYSPNKSITFYHPTHVFP